MGSTLKSKWNSERYMQRIMTNFGVNLSCSAGKRSEPPSSPDLSPIWRHDGHNPIPNSNILQAEARNERNLDFASRLWEFIVEISAWIISTVMIQRKHLQLLGFFISHLSIPSFLRDVSVTSGHCCRPSSQFLELWFWNWLCEITRANWNRKVGLHFYTGELRTLSW